jgi:hypothetical protein
MEDRISFVEHKGKQVLLVDASRCTPAEVAKIVLLVPDFTGAEFDRIAIDRLKEAAVFDRPHLKRSAWVGIDKLPHIFYEHIKNFSQRDLPTFETREKAMDWLVSGEELQSPDGTLGDLTKRRPMPSGQ